MKFADCSEYDGFGIAQEIVYSLDYVASIVCFCHCISLTI